MFEELTPEERLLRLIKGKKPDAAKEKIAPAEPAERRPQAEQKPLRTEKAVEKQPYRSARSGYKGFDISKYTNFLYIGGGVILIFILTVFLVTTFTGKDKDEVNDLEKMLADVAKESKEDLTKPPAPKEPAKDIAGSRPEPKPESSFDEYQKLLETKTIFAPPSKERAATASAGTDALRDMVKDLRLVGVAPGEEPQAIIEDKKSSQTFFLKKGEYIGDIELRDILEGKVVLGYGEETITLSL